MKIRYLLPIVHLISLMACLAPKLKTDFEADLRRWVGRPIAEFALYKGSPEQVKPRLEGGETYVFMSHQYQATRRDPVRFANADGTLGGTNIMMGGGPRYCRLILETNAAGIIQTTRWEGNDCW